MTDRGWIHRNTIIWYKRNAMPSSVKDRFTVDYEPVFFFTKQQKYYFEQQFEPYTQPMNRWGGEKLKVNSIECVSAKGIGYYVYDNEMIKCRMFRHWQTKANSDWDKGTNQNTYRDKYATKSNGRNMRVWDLPQAGNSSTFFIIMKKLVERMIKRVAQNLFVINVERRERELLKK